MVSQNFYLNLKKTLESEYFRKQYIEHSKDINLKRQFLKYILCYLISTRDFDGFEEYCTYYCDENFPYRYLKEKHNLSVGEIEQLIYDNYIKNGFLFHVTPSVNTKNILTNGLRTLNDQYGFNIYKECQKLNNMGIKIYQRNQNKKYTLNAFKNLIGFNFYGAVPDSAYYEERFNQIFLSLDLDYILNGYGNYSEFRYLFVEGINYAFGFSDLTVDELKRMIYEFCKIRRSLIIFESEIEQIVDLYEKFYLTRQPSNEKTILLVPTNSINSNSEHFSIYKENSNNLSVKDIINLGNREINNIGNIPKENIIAIQCDEDKCLVLKSDDLENSNTL